MRDLVVAGLDAACTPQAPAAIRLHDVQGACVREWIARGSPAALLRLEGAATGRIVLGEGDAGSLAKLVDLAAGVPHDALLQLNQGH